MLRYPMNLKDMFCLVGSQHIQLQLQNRSLWHIGLADKLLELLLHTIYRWDKRNFQLKIVTLNHKCSHLCIHNYGSLHSISYQPQDNNRLRHI